MPLESSFSSFWGTIGITHSSRYGELCCKFLSALSFIIVETEDGRETAASIYKKHELKEDQIMMVSLQMDLMALDPSLIGSKHTLLLRNIIFWPTICLPLHLLPDEHLSPLLHCWSPAPVLGLCVGAQLLSLWEIGV